MSHGQVCDKTKTRRHLLVLTVAVSKCIATTINRTQSVENIDRDILPNFPAERKEAWGTRKIVHLACGLRRMSDLERWTIAPLPASESRGICDIQ